MKKLFLIVVLALSYMGLSAQSVDDWFPNRTKVNFKDSTNFVKAPLINTSDTVATLRDVRTGGGGGGSIDMSLVRVAIGDSINALRPFIIYVADTSSMLAPYVRKAEVTAITDLKLDISDTTDMLDPYIREAEVTAITDLKLDIADTTNMLSKYIRIADTLDMLDPYLLEINAADTYAPTASPTFSGTVTLPTGVAASTNDVHDTIQLVRDNAVLGVAYEDYEGGSTGNDYYLTPDQVKGYIAAGGGGIFTEKMLSFRVGDTYAPDAGDSIVIHNDFSGKVLDVYRDGDYQTPRFTATNTRCGYRLDGDTVTVNPVFQAGEDWVINVKDPVSRNLIALEGAENTLLDGLVAYYKFDETSGTALTDEIGGNTATLDGDINQTGIINQAVGITANNDDIVIPYSEGVTLGESEQFSVSMWFYAEDLPSTTGRGFMLFQQNNSVSPLAPHRAGISSSTDKIFFIVNTDAPSDIGVNSSAAITADTWHHVVLICPGIGSELQIWLDGVDVSSGAETVDGNLRDGNQYLCVGNAYNAATSAFYGEIDEFAIYNKVLTESEILKLYNSGSGNQYPFE